MRYGNSQGQNTGKKYFIRSKATLEDIKGEAIASEFKKWFGAAYGELVKDLRRKQIFDDELFNETFLKIYDTLLYTDPKIDNFKAYFIRAYFTNRTQLAIKENRYVFVDLSYVNENADSNIALTYEHNLVQLESDIYRYVKDNYPKDEYELFRAYFPQNTKLSYNTLSELMKVPAYKIHKIISKIKRDLSKNENLRNQFNERFHQNNIYTIKSKVMEEKQTKSCAKCKEVKPVDKYSKNSSAKDGLHYYCKDCQAIIQKKYMETKREAASEEIKLRHIFTATDKNDSTLKTPISSFTNTELIDELRSRGFKGQLTYSVVLSL